MSKGERERDLTRQRNTLEALVKVHAAARNIFCAESTRRAQGWNVFSLATQYRRSAQLIASVIHKTRKHGTQYVPLLGQCGHNTQHG